MAMNRLRPLLLAVAIVPGLAGCQSLAEQRAAFEAAIAESCRSQGFTEGTDAWRLCLLLERTDARLAILERRLDQLEFDVRRLDTLSNICRRCP